MPERSEAQPAEGGQAPSDADISPAGRMALLDIAFSRINYGFGGMVVVGLPFAAWYAYLGQDPLGLLLWVAGYGVGKGVVGGMHRRYRRERAAEDADHAADYRRWLPRVQGMALVCGAGLGVLPLLTAQHASFEFQLLYLLTVAAIVAGNPQHSSPVLSVFRCFFLAGWGGVTLLVPYSFPDHWIFVLPLALLHAQRVLRHSADSHAFFVQNIVMREERARLADGYRQAKEAAEKALYDKNLFLTTASHDLRQPVHAMGFLVEAIAQNNRDPGLAPALTDLRQSVRLATQMFNALLDLSRIESGRVQVKAEAVDLSEVVSHVATLFREEARDRGLALRVHRPVGEAIVLADAMLLRQALGNLLHNALRYTRAGGILLAVRRRSDGWRCEVWDTGIGIAMRDGADIFSPFFRNEHAWDIDSAGHGLGLAVVARCCALMGAEYGFRSREGRGSCFWIRLAAVASARPAGAELLPVLPNAPTQPSWSGRCLVIDDDPLVRSAWETLMQSWGLQVACVESGGQALRLIEGGFQADAIFCDQRLRSGESGFDLLRSLLEHLPDASGAMISGELDSPELAAAEEQGYLVLRKPVEPAALQAVLGHWLSPSRRAAARGSDA